MANRCLGFALALLPALCAAAPSDFFEQRIRPLFVKRCQGCHPIAKLSSAAVVAGNPEASVLYQAVARTHATPGTRVQRPRQPARRSRAECQVRRQGR